MGNRPSRHYPTTPLPDFRGARRGDAAVELFDRLLNLRKPALVRGYRKLLLEFGPCEPQRLDRPQPFRILHRAHVFLGSLERQLIHALLNARFRIDQSLACISHSSLSLLCEAGVTATPLFRTPHYRIDV